MRDHLEEVKHKRYKGARIVVNKLKEGKKVWYDCMIFGAFVSMPIFDGDNPNELVQKAKEKIDHAEKYRDKLQ